MRLLRNPEVLKTIRLYAITSIVVCLLAFRWDWRCAILIIGTCLVWMLIFLYTTEQRYQRMADLSLEIDRILHDSASISLDKFAEGELAILHSEMQKMVTRLKEQQFRMQKDKMYLADSLADISHQIRTPLTTIHLLISMLSERNISESRRKKLTHELYDLLGHMEWLVDALLKISKLDAGTVQFQKEQVSMKQLLDKASAPLLIPIELRLQELDIQAEGNFQGDIIWTCEALSNILKNCMEHTPVEGKIEVEALENSLYTEIKISDNGKGIDKEDLPHIFERFYKGKNSDAKSYGIGLALARMIITSQNGTIKVENKATQGALFTIRFYKGIV